MVQHQHPSLHCCLRVVQPQGEEGDTFTHTSIEKSKVRLLNCTSYDRMLQDRKK